MLQHPIVIELSQEFDLGDTPLVELKIVVLKAEADGLEQRVDDTENELVMVSIQRTEENGKEMDIAVLDLARLGEDLVENCNYLQPGLAWDTTASRTQGYVPLSPPSEADESA